MENMFQTPSLAPSPSNYKASPIDFETQIFLRW